MSFNTAAASRAFRHTVPEIWNRLTLNRTASLRTFKKRLNTKLFTSVCSVYLVLLHASGSSSRVKQLHVKQQLYYYYYYYYMHYSVGNHFLNSYYSVNFIGYKILFSGQQNRISVSGHPVDESGAAQPWSGANNRGFPRLCRTGGFAKPRCSRSRWDGMQ